MNGHASGRQQRLPIIVFSLTATVLWVAANRVAVRGEAQEMTAAVAQPTVVPEGQAPVPARAAGLMAFRDPDTGEILPHPDPLSKQELQADALREMAEWLSTSSKGLEKVESPVPGGGVMVDLRGRFQSAAVVTNVDGVTSIDCKASLPGSGAKGQ